MTTSASPESPSTSSETRVSGGRGETRPIKQAEPWARKLATSFPPGPGAGPRKDRSENTFVTWWAGPPGRAAAVWRKAAFDSRHLGVGCFRITGVGSEQQSEQGQEEEILEALLRRVLRDAAPLGADYLFFRVDGTRLAVIRGAERARFRMIGVHLEFDRPVDAGIRELPSGVRRATRGDAEAISRLGEVFRSDRLHRDGGFDPRRVERLWRESIRNGLENWADAVYVFELEAGIAGFVTLTPEGSEHPVSPEFAACRIFLIGVSPEARGLGAGTALVRAALWHAAKEGFSHVRVGTQAGNDGAIGLYQGEGFRLRDLFCELSRWLR